MPFSEGVDCALDGGAVGARDVDRLGPLPVEGSQDKFDGFWFGFECKFTKFVPITFAELSKFDVLRLKSDFNQDKLYL